ncbi:MAG: hypothetical protein JOY64_08590 [Alphaproteobacteria bacterium]|nr:hypothetical protein [Alphaproteobacteria bacterium]MBV8407673.1 hypothetical protein [Alphaproteobacteria bacterium]
MPIKNNDDVAHLLEATGGSGSSYREFESPTDQMSAPLIDAVFAKGPPEPTPDMHSPAPLQRGLSSSDILSEVFEGPRPMTPASTYPAPNSALAFGYPQGAGQFPPHARPPLASLHQGAASKRSLSDIRRIITKPAEEIPGAPTSGDLNGLFDRLAG